MLYIMKNMSLIFNNCEILLAHINYVFQQLGTHSCRLGACFGVSDDYRNVPYRLENI